MTATYSDLISNVKSLDLEHLSWKSIYQCAQDNELSEIGIDYLKKLHQNRTVKKDKVSRVYLDGNFILGIQQVIGDSKILNLSSLTEDVTHIRPIELTDIEDQIRFRNTLRYAFLFKKLKMDQTDWMHFMAQNEVVNKRHLFDFTHDIINFDLSRLSVMNCETIQKDYGVKIVFTENDEHGLDKQRMYCKNIYFKKGLPILFLFQNIEGLIEGWNKHYFDALNNLEPIKELFVNKEEKLNAILDKISQLGMSNLTNDELVFLKNY